MAKIKVKTKAKTHLKGKAKAKATGSKPKPRPKMSVMQHKPGCETFSGAPAKLCADYNRKMYVCESCGVPDTTPKMAKTAFKMMQKVVKVAEAVMKDKEKRVSAKFNAKFSAAPKTAPVEAAVVVEAAPAPTPDVKVKVEGEAAP